jgi:hypothetical protein
VNSPEQCARQFNWKLVPECAIKRKGQIDALDDVLYLPMPRLRQAGALTPAEIKIIEQTNYEHN